jgi:hypothetical protein
MGFIAAFSYRSAAAGRPRGDRADLPVRDSPTATIGTPVSVYEDAALVEVSDDVTGEGLAMFVVSG